MKKLSVKDIIDFKRKSERSRKTFAANLKLDFKKANVDGGGGDYWITSLSAICNAYKSSDLKFIKEKINELKGKLDSTDRKQTRITYQRNIDILEGYKDLDFKKWKTLKKTFLKQKINSVLTIKGLEIQIVPRQLVVFKKNDTAQIGAIWFIAKKDGYRKDELAMFSDILYRYLKTDFSDKNILMPEYCIAVDVVNCFEVNFSQVQKAEIPAILIPTIEEIKRLI